MDFFETVSKLCQAPGPSGFETHAVEAARELLSPLVHECRIDRLGSLIGIRYCGKPNARKVLLDAHLDEVGMIVTGHEDGFLKYTTLGGIDPRVMLDREVTVMTQKPMLGIVAVKPPHLMLPGEADQSIPHGELYVDVGLTQDEAEKRIPIGTPMVFKEGTYRLGKDRIAGKSLDDRACFSILLRVMELIRNDHLDIDVAVLGSCFEETSGDGALVATFAENPTCAIAVDVTFGKTHDGPKDVGFSLGSGPAVGIGPNCSRWMNQILRSVANEEGIPWNPEIMAGETGTNGWDMQVAREGIPVAIVSLPLNYMHTPLEVISMSDAEQCAQLIAGFLRKYGREGI